MWFSGSVCVPQTKANVPYHACDLVEALPYYDLPNRVPYHACDLLMTHFVCLIPFCTSYHACDFLM